MARSKTLEGWLKALVHGGDDFPLAWPVLCKDKDDRPWLEEATNLAAELLRYRGRRVRVTVEVLEEGD